MIRLTILFLLCTTLDAQEPSSLTNPDDTRDLMKYLTPPSLQVASATSATHSDFSLTATPAKLTIPAGTTGVMVVSQTNSSFTGVLTYQILNLSGVTSSITLSGNTAFIYFSVPLEAPLETKFGLLQGTANGTIKQIPISIVVTDKAKLKPLINTGAVLVSSTPGSGQAVDFTQLGTADWFATGQPSSQYDPLCPYYGPCATSRKVGGSGLVAAINGGRNDGWFYPFSPGLVNLTWTNGTNAPNGVASHINNTFFQLQAFAGTQTRVLTLVAGLAGGGTLVSNFHLTDGTTADTTDIQTINGTGVRVFTIRFNAASAGHQLVVTVSHTGGELLLYGAALSGELAPQPHFLQVTDNLQAFVGAVTAGDTLVLPDGYSFTGHIVLPARLDTGWVDIRSNLTLLPGQRVRPGEPKAVLISPDELPVLQNDASNADHASRPAHGWRFTGLEMTVNNTKAHLNYGLISFTLANDATVKDISRDIIFEQCYIHGDSTSDYVKGIVGNANNISVVDSYVGGFVSHFMEANSINIYSSAGPIRLINNYLEASAENVMIGGSGPDLGPSLVPTNGLIQHNYFFKPLAWRGSPFIIKNLLEFKDGYNFIVDSNVFENNWEANQNGFALLLTPRTGQGGTPLNHVDTITFSNNILRHSGSGLNLGLYDDQAKDSNGNTIPPSQLQLVHDVTIRNNLFDDLSLNYAEFSHGIQIFGPPNKLIVDHNTFQFAELTNDHGWFLAGSTGESPSNASIIGNDFGADLYGDTRGPGAAVLTGAVFASNNIRNGSPVWRSTPGWGNNTLLNSAPAGVGADVSGLLGREASVKSGNRN